MDYLKKRQEAYQFELRDKLLCVMKKEIKSKNEWARIIHIHASTLEKFLCAKKKMSFTTMCYIERFLEEWKNDI